MDVNFCNGMLVGAVIAGVIGFVISHFLAARGRVGQMNRTMDHFPHADQPKLTPRHVVSKSISSAFGCVFWFLAFVAVIGSILAWLYYSYHK